MQTLVTAWLLETTRPTRKPQEAKVHIKRCASTNWAVTSNGRKFLIGTSAFFTSEAALRRWQGNLDRIVSDNYTRRMRPDLWEHATRLAQVRVYRRVTSNTRP